MKRKLITTGMLIVIGLSSAQAIADDAKNKQITELTERVRVLEERLDKIERFLQMKDNEQRPPNISAALQDRVQKRFEQDKATYTQEQLGEIESLYQIANKKWDTQEAKDSLKKLIDKYPKANRAGCAVLYLGQMSSGEDKEKALKQAIDSFGDCCYGDAVQVGSYARLQLADYYSKNGRQQEADALIEEILKKFPDAVDHDGHFIKEILNK